MTTVSPLIRGVPRVAEKETTSQKKTEHVDVWLPLHLKLTLGLLAQRDRRRLSEYVRLILEQHVEVVANDLQESE